MDENAINPYDPEEIAWADLSRVEWEEILSAPWTTKCVFARRFVEMKKQQLS